MAESELAQTIREAYAKFNRGDFDAVLELLDENVEWVPPPTSPEPDPLYGREAAREYMVPNLFDEQTAEPLEILEQGDRVLVVARIRARGSGSGAEIDQTIFHLWQLDGERAVRFEVHMDREHALAALHA
jgi:ketosteroid isomerase-like protein